MFLSWLFYRKDNSGKRAHAHAYRQTKQKTRLRKGGEKGQSSVKAPKKKIQPPFVPQLSILNDVALSSETKYIKLLVANDGNIDEIEKGMKHCFEERRKLIHEGQYNTCAILEAYPHLKSFQGQMIDFEFGLGYREDKINNILKNFHDVLPGLVLIAKRNKTKFPQKDCFAFTDVVLNGIIILSKFLPRPKRCYDFEANMSTTPLIEDIFEVILVGSNIPEAITEKRGRCNYPIQLYILAVGDSNKFHSLILVLGTLPLRALDLLFKLHFVLQSHLVLGWKNVFRFLQIHVSKVPITADQAKNRHSTFVEQFKEIMSQN